MREPILTVDHAARPNHNGGQLQFGRDGHLYLSTGDGGGAGDPDGNGQDPTSLLGKILRVEPRPGAEPEIWSSGLRNPWRFSFDRASGDMVIADVGQSVREEIDFAPSPAAGIVGGGGANYGWNCREGSIAYVNAPESCDGASGFTDPVFDYPHADPEDGTAHGCSITGGYVVRDPSLGDLYGRYLYADFCVGQIRSLELPAVAGGTATGDRSEGLVVPNPTSFGEDSCGRLYVTSNGGAVYGIEGDVPPPCPLPAASQTAGPPPVSAAAKRVRMRIRLSKRVREVKGGLKLLLTVRVLPCAGQGRRVQLNRGGRPLGSKPLNRRCVAHFRLRIAHPSTFRALLPETGYRSQVLTIALAKPRP